MMMSVYVSYCDFKSCRESVNPYTQVVRNSYTAVYECLNLHHVCSMGVCVYVSFQGDRLALEILPLQLYHDISI